MSDHPLLAAALIALSACTDPTAVGPRPEYLGVGNEQNLSLATAAASLLPADSCPMMRRATGATRRVRIPGTALSVAFNADVRVEERTFGTGLGGVIFVPGVGGIASTPSPNFPFFFFPTLTGDRQPYGLDLPAWCSMTIGGLPATVNFTSFVTERTRGGFLTQLIGNDVVIGLANSNGQTIRIRVFAAPPNNRSLVARDQLQIQPLLDAVAGLEL